MRRVVVCLVAMALVAPSLGACTSSDTGRQGRPVSRKVAAQDPKRARRAVLRAADVPAGWEPSSDEDGTSADWPDVRECRRLEGFERKGRTAEESSPSFEKGPAILGGSVALYRSVAAAENVIERFLGDEGRRCIEAGLRAEAEEGMRDEDPGLVGQARISLEVGDLSVPDLGDDARGLSVVLQASFGGITVPVYVDVVLVRVGRAALLFMFMSFGVPPDEPTRSHVLTRGVERAQRAIRR